MIFLTDGLQRLVGLFNIRSLEAGKFQEAVKIHLLQIMILADNTTNKSDKSIAGINRIFLYND